MLSLATELAFICAAAIGHYHAAFSMPDFQLRPHSSIPSLTYSSILTGRLSLLLLTRPLLPPP